MSLPAGDTPEPFIDIDDIADVAVAAAHRGRPRGRGLRSHGTATAEPFADAVAEMSQATGRELRLLDDPERVLPRGPCPGRAAGSADRAARLPIRHGARTVATLT